MRREDAQRRAQPEAQTAGFGPPFVSRLGLALCGAEHWLALTI